MPKVAGPGLARGGGCRKCHNCPPPVERDKIVEAKKEGNAIITSYLNVFSLNTTDLQEKWSALETYAPLITDHLLFVQFQKGREGHGS